MRFQLNVIRLLLLGRTGNNVRTVPAAVIHTTFAARFSNKKNAKGKKLANE